MQIMLRFNEVWLSEAQFSEWLVQVSNDDTRAYCRWCGIVLRAHKTDLTTHAGTAKHNKNAMNAESSSSGPISVEIVSSGDERIQFARPCIEQQIHFDEMGNPRGSLGQGRSPYTKKYRTVWESIPELKNWLTEFPPDLSKAFCKVCEVQLRAHKHDLMIHAKSLKHKKAEELYMSSGRGGDGEHFMTESFNDGDEFQDAEDDRLNQKLQPNDFTDHRNGDDETEEQEHQEGTLSRSQSQPSDHQSYEPSTSSKRSDAEVSIIRVPGKPFQNNNTRTVSRKRRLGASDVIEAIEKNDFTGYELLQIVKAAIPKL